MISENFIFIREPTLADETIFISAMLASRNLHFPWIKAPTTHEEYLTYLKRYQQPNMKSFLLMHPSNKIIGVFSLSDIMPEPFQSTTLGFYACQEFSGQGYMKKGLILILKKAFTELNLHRLEASIQPDNIRSLALVRRCGFRKEGIALRYIKINAIWKDMERWAMTLEDWKDIYS